MRLALTNILLLSKFSVNIKYSLVINILGEYSDVDIQGTGSVNIVFLVGARRAEFRTSCGQVCARLAVVDRLREDIQTKKKLFNSAAYNLPNGCCCC